jgi:hypothetical protein
MQLHQHRHRQKRIKQRLLRERIMKNEKKSNLKILLGTVRNLLRPPELFLQVSPGLKLERHEFDKQHLHRQQGPGRPRL